MDEFVVLSSTNFGSLYVEKTTGHIYRRTSGSRLPDCGAKSVPLLAPISWSHGVSMYQPGTRPSNLLQRSRRTIRPTTAAADVFVVAKWTSTTRTTHRHVYFTCTFYYGGTAVSASSSAVWMSEWTMSTPFSTRRPTDFQLYCPSAVPKYIGVLGGTLETL